MTLIGFLFPKLQTTETLLDKCLKSAISEDRFKSKMADVSKRF